jgi:hypothetical protein
MNYRLSIPNGVGSFLLPKIKNNQKTKENEKISYGINNIYIKRRNTFFPWINGLQHIYLGMLGIWNDYRKIDKMVYEEN